MKLKATSLFSALLLTLAAASFAEGAGNAPAPAAPAAPAVSAQDEAPVLVTTQGTVESNCEQAASAPLFQVAFEKPQTSLALKCGSCSTSNCRGANRGQMCWTGGVNGQWGNCNIYSGGNICDTGGWECQCGVGPLP